MSGFGGLGTIAQSMDLIFMFLTIKKHVKSMFQKTGCTTRTQLAVMALESGIVVRGI